MEWTTQNICGMKIKQALRGKAGHPEPSQNAAAKKSVKTGDQSPEFQTEKTRNHPDSQESTFVSEYNKYEGSESGHCRRQYRSPWHCVWWASVRVPMVLCVVGVSTRPHGIVPMELCVVGVSTNPHHCAWWAAAWVSMALCVVGSSMHHSPSPPPPP